MQLAAGHSTFCFVRTGQYDPENANNSSTRVYSKHKFQYCVTQSEQGQRQIPFDCRDVLKYNLVSDVSRACES